MFAPCCCRQAVSFCIQRNGVACRAIGGSTGSSTSADGAAAGVPVSVEGAPWELGNYYSKKLERRTDSLGNMISNPDTLAAPPNWTPDTQLRLAAEVLAPGLQQDAEALLEKVRQLQALLPGMDVALRRMKPADLVRMAAHLEQVTQQLIVLRDRFPATDVAAMVAAHPPLLQMSPDELNAAVEAVQQAFPDASEADLEAMLSANGALLDGGKNVRRCLAGVGHLLTRPQIMRSLQQDPAFLYQFQPLESLSRGERDAQYLADMWRPQ